MLGRTLTVGEGAGDGIAQGQAAGGWVFVHPGLGRPGKDRALGLHLAEQKIVLAADMIARQAERTAGVRQRRAADQAVTAAVIMVDRPFRRIVEALKEALKIAAMMGDIVRGPGAHGPEDHVRRMA